MIMETDEQIDALQSPEGEPQDVSNAEVQDSIEGLREDIREGISVMKEMLAGVTTPQINIPAQKVPNIYVEPAKVSSPAINVSVPDIKMPEMKFPETKRPTGMTMKVIRDSAGRMSHVDVEFKF